MNYISDIWIWLQGVFPHLCAYWFIGASKSQFRFYIELIMWTNDTVIVS